VARTITDTLSPSDFERPVYRDLFELIATQIEAGKLHASDAAPNVGPRITRRCDDRLNSPNAIR